MASGDNSNGKSTATGVASVADAIKLARTIIEERFVSVGQNLETSIDIHTRLTSTFQSLLAEFESDDLQQAARDLSEAASAVVSLSGAYRGERGTLEDLNEAVAVIEECVAKMEAAIKTVAMLGVSAKIEATHLGDTGSDFQAFAEEITRSLQLAQTNLHTLTREIAEVRSHLMAASDAEKAFDSEHAEGLRLIPERLASNVTSITDHHSQAIAATSRVAELSGQLTGRIGEAVMALQIGDITRQRIEHVEQALALLDIIGKSTGSPDDADTEEWGSLTTEERQWLIALGYKLQSVQLSDTLEEFDREGKRVVGSLKDLARSAGDIVELGERAYGGTGGHRNTFLLELEDDVYRARSLLKGFGKAREHTDDVVEAVRNATTRLIDHIDVIQSLEADVRIVGLNTSFKCGRLGQAGRPLSIIAQELRACSKITAVEADAVMIGLDRMTSCIGALSDQSENQRAGAIASIGDSLTASVGRLGSAGHGLANALTVLKQDSDEVTGLIEGTISRVRDHHEIDTVLRQASADLAKLAEDAELAAGAQMATSDAYDAAKMRMLAAFSADYTMAQERETHTRIAGDTGAVSSAPPAENARETDAGLDDFLF